METEVYTGSCLCEAVTFRFNGPPSEVLHCHCRMCRKMHGAAYATFARVAHDDFRFIAGKEHVVTYRSSEQACRTFCGVCGSSLQFIRDNGNTFGLAVSAIDTPIEPQPVREFHGESKIDWLLFEQSRPGATDR